MGARGNSGVILSQILRGFADGLSEKERFDSQDFVAALDEATPSGGPRRHPSRRRDDPDGHARRRRRRPRPLEGAAAAT